MENTVSLEVKLRGGEALYVTPVSIDWHNKDSKFYIYDTIEFLPTIPWALKHGGYDNGFHHLQLWSYRITKATIAFLERFPYNIRHLTGSNVFHDYFKHWTWDWGIYYVNKELTNDWFYAMDIFQPYEPLHIRGNIEIESSFDVDKYVAWGDIELGYLPPSSLYIEERLKERFHVWTYNDDEDKVAEEKFWKWRQEQIDKGYKVYYITSLET